MKNIVHNMDCLELMEELPENYFDLAICDPPYGIGAGKGTEIYLSNNGKQDWKGKKKNDNTIYGEWDNSMPEKRYFDLLKNISRNQVIWGGNYFTDYLRPVSSWVVWDKKNGDSFFADGELAWTSFNNKMRIFQFLSCGFMGSHKKRDRRIHPTQKPVALYKWILQNYAKPGMKIFDSHVGSGSSRIACYDMGFDFVGCELDSDYWQAQEERFQNHIKQADLFTPEERQEMIYKEQELF